ncbi:aromatic amino acid ammonia-lyase [Christiangramia sp. SM2212]|uniref:Aromatic amino acid ammonia-lyase n=1 Tax=Christiangramia sediminicola TaxID=3073267 RepID=A0ABU1EQP9_9FLAO|nr:aromatic amino acid ammonia-lyase [Christiangramia sp. SM2212]MDR5590342.1 aromatic amino acid ammonia-lyase [Christiangramia sp. SM2212]
MLNLNNALNFDDFYKVLFENEKIELGKESESRITESFEFLKDFSRNKIIYGVNTGFGPMAQYKINDEDKIKLQLNLIRSHASGAGDLMQPDYVKALMLARLNTLCLGKSGIHKSVALSLIELINNNITPVIFEHGGVGASGDLVQLAHLALVLVGEGEVIYKGKRRDTVSVFQELGIKPAEIKIREGLAVMNGTSAMTGIGIVNLIYSKRLLKWAVFCSSVINEIVQAYDDHLSEELNSAKLHPGQQKIAKVMRKHLSDSKLTRDRNDHLYSNGADKNTFFKEKVQEYYSLRCVPQILGPVSDTLDHSLKILLEEVNSANDNPIIDVKTEHVYHGGNFHGDYVSLEMDKLRLAITKTSMLAERQLNYLLNAKLNDILPPFVNMGTLGLNFGMQGAQFTAVSTTAENQMLSNSMYVHSIPNNNDNQDIVSMGANSANMTKKVIENSFEVLSTELATIIQALYYLDFDDKLSSATKQRLEELRKIIPQVQEDRPLYKEISELKEYLRNNEAY